MKILAIEKENPDNSEKDFQPHLKDEAQHVWQIYKSGVLREIYFNQDHCAVLILECSDLEEAKKILDRLPLVSKGLITFELIELNPYTGFERLFS